VKQLANPLSHQRTVAKWLVITQQKTLGKSLVIAIPLLNQPKNFWPGTRKTVAKWLVIAIRLGYQKALHSHSAKSPKYGDISRWLTIAKWLVIAVFKFGLKSINRRSG